MNETHYHIWENSCPHKSKEPGIGWLWSDPAPCVDKSCNNNKNKIYKAFAVVTKFTHGKLGDSEGISWSARVFNKDQPH